MLLLLVGWLVVSLLLFFFLEEIREGEILF